MNVLALETSGYQLSVALWCDGQILERSEEHRQGGSGRVLPWVQDLLAEAGLSLSQIDGVAFGAGPGSFTGLRLACGVAQGLACGLEVPVMGVGTLEALALAADVSQRAGDEAGAGVGMAAPLQVLACLDARMNEVYCAAYRLVEGRPEEVLAPFVAAPEEVVFELPGNWLGCGDGFATYPELLQGRLYRHMPELRPGAAAVARLAVPRLARGEGQDAAQAAPLYVRDKVALTTAERLARGGLK